MLVDLSIATLQYGDIICNETSEMKVLAVINNVIIPSYSGNFDKAGTPHTVEELHQMGFKLKIKK